MTATQTSAYIADILAAYRSAPGTRGVARAADRRLAADLARRGVPREAVLAAILLATARRLLRNPAATPLPPISSLHYFAPVVDELLEAPLDPDYIEHLRNRLKPLAPALVSTSAPHHS